MRMIPMRSKTIFKNRWMALIWAAGIIWFAYDVAGSQPQSDGNAVNADQPSDSNGTPDAGADEKKLAQALNSF